VKLLVDTCAGTMSTYCLCMHLCIGVDDGDVGGCRSGCLVAPELACAKRAIVIHSTRECGLERVLHLHFMLLHLEHCTYESLTALDTTDIAMHR